MSTPPEPTFRWLRTGRETLEAMLEAINSATVSVRLEMYIFADSPVGERFREALMRACARGVRVRVLIDALGSLTLSESFWSPLQKAGGEFRWFNPLSLRRLAYRNHRKILVCDERVAFTGGINIAPEYEGDGVTSGWCDLGLILGGPPAVALAETFDDLFEQAEARHKRFQPLRRARIQVAAGAQWKLLLSGPGRRHGEIKRALARDIEQARSVQIVCAYFLPTWKLRRELVRAVRRGARVQLILAGRSDVRLSQLASRRLYASFLRRGIEIYEYEPQILHAKLFILDGIAYAGSSNLDTRSLQINYELAVRLEIPSVAAEGREIFLDLLRHSRRIDPATWRRSRTFVQKLQEAWAYLILGRLDPWLARWQVRPLK
jgi:cardiolipin synthase